jgi:hypothetical protein
MNTTVTPIVFKPSGEPVAIRWTSEAVNVSGIVIGAGGDTCTEPHDQTQPLPHTGTVETCDGAAGGGGGPSPTSVAGVISVVALAGGERLAPPPLVSRYPRRCITGSHRRGSLRILRGETPR